MLLIACLGAFAIGSSTAATIVGYTNDTIVTGQLKLDLDLSTMFTSLAATPPNFATAYTAYSAGTAHLTPKKLQCILLGLDA